MSQVMDHVRELADVIGPRPACTDAEARAADYIEELFQARGLETERDDFDCPRTDSWARVVYHLLTLGAAVFSIWMSWPAFAIAVVAAVGLLFELSTRFTIARFLGKGPSQNIIARHVPRQRRGERLKRIVIVAHYDSVKSSLTYSPGLVRNMPLLLALTKWTTLLTPVVILFGALPFAKEWRPWTGYAACVAAAYLLFPLVVAVHRELFSRATDGANDNATGVAAMLGVMEATVPESEEGQYRDRPHRRAEAAFEADTTPDESLLEYRSVTTSEPAGVVEQRLPLNDFGDVDWETGRLEPVQRAESRPPAREFPQPAAEDWGEEADIGSLWDEKGTPAVSAHDYAPARPAARPAPAPVPVDWSARPAIGEPEEEAVPEGQGSLSFDEPPARQRPAEPAEEPEDEQHAHGISAWLGIGKGFDVRKAGKKIGSWDNIDDDDDDFGSKGGSADDGLQDPVAVDVAARIRRRVTESVDRALTEKEIWFVATGADEAGGWGMRHLLEAYPDEMADALIINIDSVGAGTVSFVTDEGAGRSYHADRRLIAQAKRTVRESGLTVKSASYRGFTTSATPALARRFKAMTVTAFDINGRVPNLHWHTDVSDNVIEQTVIQATEFVTALLRDL